MRIGTRKIRVDLSSHDVDDETLKVLGSAVGVALSMITRSHYLPFMVVNEFDVLDGHNLSVVCTTEIKDPL